MVVTGVRQAEAANKTWDGGGANAIWNTAANWNADSNPLAGDDVFFNSTFTSGTAITLGANRVINSLTFDTATSFSIATSAQSLQLTSGSFTRETASSGTQTVSAEVALATNGTWAINGSGALLVSGPVTGNFTLTKSGTGLLVLSGVNTFNNLTINAGTVRGTTSTSALGDTNLTLNGGNLELANNTGLNFARPTTISQSGTIFSERLAAGAGVTHTLGALSIGAQTLTLATDATVTSGTAGLTFGAVTLSADGATFISSATNTLLTLGGFTGAGLNFTVGGAGNTTISGIIGTTTGGLTKTGAGTLTLSGANTFSGATTLSSGTLVIGNTGALANSTLDLGTGPAGTLSFGALTTGSVGGLTGTNGLALSNASGGAVNLAIGGTSQTASYSGVLSGAGSLTKVGTGNLTLGSLNTYTGTTAILSGTLSTDSMVVSSGASGLGNASSAVTLGDATNQGALSYTGIAATFTRGFTLGAGGGRIDVTTAGETLTVGTGNIAGSGLFTVGGAGDLIVSSTITTGANGLTKSGSGTLTLAAANTYTGLTTISNGTLRYGIANAISSGGITVTNGATLDMATFSDSVGTVTLTSGIIVGTGTLTSSANFATTSGTISAVLAGTGIGVTQGTSGTTVLTGANTFTGASSVNAGGTLRIANALALGGTASNVSVASGGALELSGDITVGNKPINLLQGTGIANGGALRSVSGSNTWGGLITFNNATRINADAGSTLTLDVPSGNAIAASNDALSFGGDGNIAVKDPIAATVAAVTKDGAGTLTLSASNAYGGTMTVNAGVLRATTSASALSTTGLTLGGGNVELANDSGLNFGSATVVNTSGTIFSERLTGGAGVTHTLGTLAISSQTLTLATDASVISGTAGLTFGTVTLSTPGGATFNADAGTLLTLGAFSGNTFGFTVGGAGDTTITGAIATTTGTLAKNGAGTLTLSAANTYSGLTTISSGTLRYGIANAIGTGGITLQNGATLDLSTFSDSVGAITLTSGNIIGSGTLTSTANFATTSGTISAALAGTVGLVQSGNGTTVLSGANAFSGTTTLTSGTLVLANSGALANSVLNLGTGVAGTVSFGDLTSVAVGGLAGGNNLALANASGNAMTLVIGGTTQVSSYSGVLSGAGGLTKVGTGGLTLGSANTYTGTTAILSGTVSTVSIVVATGVSGLGNASTAVALGDAATQGALAYTGNSATYTRGFALGAGGGRLNVTTAGQTLTIDTANVTGSGTFSIGGAGNVIMNAALQQSGGLVKDGAGTLTLAAANTYTGTTTVSAGVLNVQNESALGTTPAGITVAAGAALEMQGVSILSKPLTIGSTGVGNGGGLRSASGTVSFGGAITQTAASRINADAGLLTLSGSIGGAFALSLGGAGDITAGNVIGIGTGSLTKDGAGTLTLSAANTYTGVTTISGGTLRYGANNALSTGGITIANGGTLDIAAFSDSVGEVILTSGNIIGTGTLTSTVDFTTTTGTISVSLAGATAGIQQQTSGTTVLTTANTFGAAGTVSAGVLEIRNGDALGSTTAGLTVNGGSLWLSGNIAVAANPLSIRGVGVGTTGALLNVSGTNSYAGVLTVANTLTIGSSAGLLTLSGTLTGSTRATTFDGGGDITLSGSTIVGSIIKNGTGRLTISGGNGTAGVTTINVGVVRAASDSALGTTAGATTVASGAALELAGNISIGAENLTSFAGTGISNGGALRSVSGTNSFAGAITQTAASRINSDAGSLTLSGAIGGAFGLTFGGAGDTVVSGTVATGANPLTKDGPGTLTLSAANTFSGTTAIQAGTISVASVLPGAVNQPLGTAARLDLGVASTSSGRLLYTGGSGTLSKNVFALGNGTDTIQNAGSGLLTLSGTLTKNGTILRLQGGSQGITVTGRITGTSANSDLAVQNGLTTLSTTNNYVGPTFINSSGTLALGISNAIPSNSIVTIGGTFAGGDGGPGTLSTGTFTNSIGGLAFSGSGGTIQLTPTLSQTSTLMLSATGSVVLNGAPSTLDLGDTALTAGLYRLIAGNVLTGSFGTVTGLDSNYLLRYGTVNANSLDAQRKADQAATFTMTTGTVTRALVNTNVTLSGTITNTTSQAGASDLTLGLASTGLTGSGFTTGSVAPGASVAVSGTLNTGSTAGSSIGWTVVNTDANAIQTTSTATGSLNVVNQRVFTTSTSTLALGFVHQGGSIGSPTLVVTSTGLNATTANATLGSFTGGPGGFSLGLTSGSAAFLGASGTQTATYTLSGPTSTLGLISGTYASAVTAELGSIPSLTVAVTGQVYSGISTWATNGGGNWGTLTGTGANAFGTNWGANQGSPGLDAAFANTDTATFGSALTSGTAVILLNGADPSLASLTFNNANGVYDLDVGSGGTGRIILAGSGSSGRIDVLAGFHEIHTELQFGSNLAVAVAASSGLTLHGDIAGSNYSLTKSGAGLLLMRGNNIYSGGTLITGGTLALGNSGSPLGSGSVILSNGATLNLQGFTITNTIDATNGYLVNPAAANVDISGNTTVSGTGPITGVYTVLSGGTGTFTSPLGNPTAPIAGTVTVNSGGALVTTSTITTYGTVLVNADGRATLSGPVDGAITTAGSTTFGGDLLSLGTVLVTGGTTTFQGATYGDVNVGSSGTSSAPKLAVFNGTIAKTAHVYASGTIDVLGSVAATADFKIETGGVGRMFGSGTFGPAAMINNGSFVVDRTTPLTLATAITGSGGLTKLGSAALTLTGTSSFTGPTQVAAGTLVLDGVLGAGGVTVASGAILGGFGSIAGAIGGNGLIAPGNSPGILTAQSLAPTATTSFAFEFTGTAAPAWNTASSSGNDVLRLTDATSPFANSLTATNVVNVYFDVATITGWDAFQGGFYTDSSVDFLTSIQDATYAYYVRGDGNGSATTYNGQSYYALAVWGPVNIPNYGGVTQTTTPVASANFASGTVTNGLSTTFIVVPEPGTMSLALAACSLMAMAEVRRRRRTTTR